jgi:hypothetical protein
VASDGQQLDSLEFDAETRELIGLDDIKEILGEIDRSAEMDIEELEQQAKAVKNGIQTSEGVHHAGDGA